MIRERKVSETFGPKGHPAGYYVIAIDENGKRAKAFFGHNRADEYRHAQFVDKHRSPRNNKPYRSAALKRLARSSAVRIDGTFVARVGRLHHQSPPRPGEKAAA